MTRRIPVPQVASPAQDSWAVSTSSRDAHGRLSRSPKSSPPPTQSSQMSTGPLPLATRTPAMMSQQDLRRSRSMGSLVVPARLDQQAAVDGLAGTRAPVELNLNHGDEEGSGSDDDTPRTRDRALPLLPRANNANAAWVTQATQPVEWLNLLFGAAQTQTTLTARPCRRHGDGILPLRQRRVHLEGSR